MSRSSSLRVERDRRDHDEGGHTRTDRDRPDPRLHPSTLPPHPPPPGVSIRRTSPRRRGSCTCRAGARPGPRRRPAAASSRRSRPGSPPARPHGWLTRRSVMSDTVTSSSTSQVPLDAVAARRGTGTAAPAPQPVAQHPHGERPLQRLDRRVLRVGHRGVDAAHAGRSRAGPLPAGDGLVVHPAVPADQHVVHRALGRGRHPIRHGLGQRAEAHVGDPLADLDVAGADRGRERRRRRACPAERRPRPGAARRRWPGSSARPPSARAKATALTVTASTALTLPARWGSVPVKSKRDRVAVDGERAGRCDAGRCWSGADPVESSTSLEGPRRRRAARRARRASGARRSRRPRRTARRPARRGAARRHGWRRPARRGRRSARPACGTRRGRWPGRPASGAPAGGAGPPAGSRWRRRGSSPARRRRRRRGGRGWRPSRPAGRRRRRHGATSVMSLRWVPPANGSLRTTWSPGATVEPTASMAAAHRRRHRAEVHRDVLGLHEQLAVGREQRRRAVGPLLDVGAERGPAQHRAHLLGDAGQPGDRAPGARRDRGSPVPPEHERAGLALHGRRQPSGTQIVQSGSAMTPGPMQSAVRIGRRAGRRPPAAPARRAVPAGRRPRSGCPGRS